MSNNKMREALEAVYECAKDGVLTIRESAVEKVVAALTEPLRNCDVGTAEEQTKRFQKFCSAHNDCYKCDCPCDNRDGGCQIRWGQMPFVKEGEAQ